MRTPARLALCTAVLLVTGVSAAAAAGPSPTPPAHNPVAPRAAQAAQAAAAPANGVSEYVPVNPCRIADTRVAGGKLAGGASRDFYVAGTVGFLPQGGTSGGCGVPAAATAVSLNIISVASSSSSHVSAYPAGTAAPTASTLNYSKGVTTNASPTVKIRPGTAKNLSIKSGGASTHLVLDVTGYYAPPIHAVFFASDGTQYSGTSRIVSGTRTATGEYRVTIDRDVTGCSVLAVPYANGYTTYSYPSGTSVYVYMYNLSNTLSNQAYNLDVRC